MGEYLGQLRQRAGDLPILCSGDVFNKWNSPPELVNFAIKHMPRMYAIPGQHDLPYHSYKDIRKSAYWTLVEAGVITNLSPHGPNIITGDLYVWAFPWGFKITPPPGPSSNPERLQVAIVHCYVWKEGHSFPGVSEESHVDHAKLRKSLMGYDAAFFGDNHRGFLQLARGRGCHMVNVGTFMRRSSSEIDYQPCLGYLHADGKVGRRPLDTSRDDITETPKLEINHKLEPEELIDTLRDYDLDSLDFKDALRRYVYDHRSKMTLGVRQIIYEILEGPP